MQEPSLKLIREMLGETLKSLPAEELDREALKRYDQQMKKYEDFCNLENEKRQKEKEKRQKKVKEIRDQINRYPF